MELRGLGRYRLVDRVSGPSPHARYHRARHEDEPTVHPTQDEATQGEATVHATHGNAPSYLAKLLEPGRGSDAERRRGQFEHEIRLLKSFNHPCIPTLHAAGDQDGVSYMVLDRVDGVSLATLLGHDQPQPQALSREIAVYVLGQLVDAVRHVHSLEYLDDGEPTPLGVVHRDLGPHNVWVSRSGDVILYDFTHTYSQWLPPEHDEPHAGAPAYMAPERLPPEARATESSDLFSLAAILWECLRGERLFQGPTAAATREAIERFDISQPSRRVAGLSPKLGEIVRKNLDRDPERRYASAYQMLQRLAQAPEAKAAERSRQALAQRVQEVLGAAGPAKSPAAARP